LVSHYYKKRKEGSGLVELSVIVWVQQINRIHVTVPLKVEYKPSLQMKTIA
jgi:hypothetical protein